MIVPRVVVGDDHAQHAEHDERSRQAADGLIRLVFHRLLPSQLPPVAEPTVVAITPTRPNQMRLASGFE